MAHDFWKSEAVGPFVYFAFPIPDGLYLSDKINLLSFPYIYINHTHMLSSLSWRTFSL